MRAPSWLDPTRLRGRPSALDGAIAASAAVLLVLPTAIADVSPGGVVLGLALTVPLAWRRSRPVASAAIVAAAGTLQILTVPSLLAADAATLVSLYSVAAYGPVAAGRAALALAVAGATAATIRYGLLPTDGSRSATVSALGFAASLTTAAWLGGALRRLGLENERRLIERAHLLETERDQQSRLAATAERTRIAGELHDVVAHSLAVTIAQADGGQYAAASDPAAAAHALGTISVTARQALADMRALLGVLREGDAGTVMPQPDIAAIADLVEAVVASGLTVDLQIEGQPQTLPPGPQLAAYRIVQESLTNVLKHAGPRCDAAVSLYWSLNGLTVTVTDDGRGAAAVATSGDGGGQGLLGMRERAAAHGGRVDAGPRRGGGYAVRAFLPYVRSS